MKVSWFIEVYCPVFIVLKMVDFSHLETKPHGPKDRFCQVMEVLDLPSFTGFFSDHQLGTAKLPDSDTKKTDG